MTIWYTARGAGLAALVLLTVATAAGALVSAPIRSASARVIVQYLHRAAAVMGLGLLVLHIGAILADSYAGVGWLGALVPFTSGYRPDITALGSIAAYLFLLVAATGAARTRITRSARAVRAWRGVHLVSYLAWVVSALHGFTIGTDSHLAWVRWLYLGCAALVGAAVTARLRYSGRQLQTIPAPVAPIPAKVKVAAS